MGVVKNEIPILEYDSEVTAVLMPEHENLGLRLPERAVFAFLADEVDKCALARGAAIAGFFRSATKDYPVYLLREGGQSLALVQAPVGAPAAVQILDWLIAYGVRKVVSAGSCGVLEAFAENEFLVPARALRDEGTSYHYLPPARFVGVSPLARAAIEKTLRAYGLPYREVTTWTTDGFFRETREKIEYRKSEGCSVVEMECAALAACAALRGAVWGELLFTADTLADAARYDERGWGRDSFSFALRLCMEAVQRL